MTRVVWIPALDTMTIFCSELIMSSKPMHGSYGAGERCLACFFTDQLRFTLTVFLSFQVLSGPQQRQKVFFVPDSRASSHYPALLVSGVPSEDHKLLLHPAILSKTARVHFFHEALPDLLKLLLTGYSSNCIVYLTVVLTLLISCMCLLYLLPQ